jgi:hypothetical protein
MFYISTLENTRALALGELKAHKEKHAVRL